MCENEAVWKLHIANTGSLDRVLHDSLHQNVNSAVVKSKSVLTYEVPDREEWYDGKSKNEIGYVLHRDEINAWPIRITVKRKEVLDES